MPAVLPAHRPGQSASRLRGARNVALVLGSGSARGLAHIGVIETLEARGYVIKAIAGTSMGAVIGGLHALGRLHVYRDWIIRQRQSDVIRLIDWALGGGGMIRGERLMRQLGKLVGDANIEDLPIPFSAVAVDIERGREVWLSDGSLFEAIRASIAIPGLFTPHHYRGRTLVDGGVLNPVPVGPTLRVLTDCTIVVDLNAPPDPALDDPTGPASATSAAAPAMTEILTRALETMQAALTRQHLAVFQPDLVIGIPGNSCVAHEFHRAREMIELGRRLTVQQLDAALR
jgi:NTE family protein